MVTQYGMSDEFGLIGLELSLIHIEIEMSDGSYQTFMVNDEDLVNKLNDMDEGTKITFTYGAVEGQANMEILSIE